MKVLSEPTALESALYVVATPIGHLEDFSARAIAVLKQVDYIAAEDTRHSKTLLQHFGIQTALLSLHEYNETQRISRIIKDLQEGQRIALISDAGTPLISDPGFRLVVAVRAAGLRVVPIPGPCSLIAALSVAGLPTDRFVFEGFLPAKRHARQAHLRALATETRTLVFFESSHRVAETVVDLAAIFGEQRQAVVARELTKQFEQVHQALLGTLADWFSADPNRLRGEFVLVIQGAPPPVGRAHTVSISVQTLLTTLLAAVPLKRAVLITTELTGLAKNDLYQWALTLRSSAEERLDNVADD